MTATLKYPTRVPVVGRDEHGVEGSTGSVDYLRIRKFEIDFDAAPRGYGGANLPGGRQNVKLDNTTAYLAMPAGLSAAYQADYSTVDVGQSGVMGLQMAGTAMGDSKNKADEITGAIQTAASSMFPEIAFNKGASLGSSLANFAGMETQLDGKSAMALTKGKIMNPFTEQVFNGVSFRNHSFSWKMFARNKKEGEEIIKIIQYIKTGMLPAYGNAEMADKGSNDNNSWTYNKETGVMTVTKNVEGDGNEQTTEPSTTKVNLKGRFLKTPKRFNLEFVRLDPGNGSTGLRRLPHYRFQPCICTGFNVNYTPDGQYVSFKDAVSQFTNDSKTPLKNIMVPAVQIEVSFAETKILTQEDAERGY